MVTVAEVLAWKPSVIDNLAEHFYDKRTIVVRLQDEINDAEPPESWVAPARAEALRAYEEQRLKLNDIAAQLSDLALAAKEGGKEIKGAQDDLHGVLDEASGEGYKVNHQTGEVEPPKLEPPDPMRPSYHFQEDERRYEKAIVDQEIRKKEFVDRIEKAIKRAEVADVGLAKSMANAVEGKTQGGSGSLNEASASQLPPSLDSMTPEEIAEKFGNEIAIETMMAQLEVGVPIYRAINADFGGEAQYSVMQNGDVKMSLKMALGLSLGEDGKSFEGKVGAGGFTDYELTFKSKEEAEEFLDGLDDAAVNGLLGGQGARQAAVVAYINEHDVTSAKVGVYGKGEIGFETPYADGGASGRAEGWYDAKKEGGEFGIKVEASVGGNVAIGDTGAKAGGSMDLAGEVKTDGQGTPKELTLRGALTGEMANQKFGLNLPGIGSGGGGDVEIKMDDNNVMWGEMNEALRKGDMDRAADIAMDHGSAVVRATTVTTNEQEISSAEGGVQQTSSQHTWVRPPNMNEFVDFDPNSTRPAADDSVANR